MEWEKKNSFGIIDELYKINELLQRVIPNLVAEEQARLHALEKIIDKVKENERL